MIPAKVLVLGATGGTGRHVVTQAIEQGYEVTVLVRDPDHLHGARDQVRILTGDAAGDGPGLARAIRGQHAVVSTLGVGKSFKPGGLIARSTPRIVRAMEDEGVPRLIFTSAFGVGDTWQDTPLFPRLMVRLLLRDVYADKAAGEQAIRSSELDWTIAYPTALTDRPGTHRYRVGEHLPLRGMPSIPRADLAEFLVTQIADTRYLRKGVLVSSKIGSGPGAW